MSRIYSVNIEHSYKLHQILVMYCYKRSKFCYVCGHHTDKKHRENLSADRSVIFAYEHYFQCSFFQVDYAPTIICSPCSRSLRGWRNHERRYMPFKFPIRWLEPLKIEHRAKTCYFCINHNPGYRFEDRQKMQLIPGNNVVLPIIRTERDPLPIPPRLGSNVPFIESQGPLQLLPIESHREEGPFDGVSDTNIEQQEAVAGPSHVMRLSPTSVRSAHSEFLLSGSFSTQKHVITEKDFDDLCRDFRIPVYLSMDLLSRLKEWNLTDASVTVAHVRNRHHEVNIFFAEDDDLTYCCDIEGLFQYFSHPHNADEWFLFIDSSLESMLELHLKIFRKQQ